MSDILYTTAEITTILEKGQPYIEITDGEDGEGLIDFKCPVKFSAGILKQLYYDANAFSTSATLDDDITNYSMIIIIGKSTDGQQCSATVYKPVVNDKIGLFAPQITNNTAIYNKQAVYQFTSTDTIESIQNHEFRGNTSVSAGNYIKLKAVLGI